MERDGVRRDTVRRQYGKACQTKSVQTKKPITVRYRSVPFGSVLGRYGTKKTEESNPKNSMLTLYGHWKRRLHASDKRIKASWSEWDGCEREDQEKILKNKQVGDVRCVGARRR